MTEKFTKVPSGSLDHRRQFKNSFLWAHMKIRGLQFGATFGLVFGWLYLIAPAQYQMAKDLVFGNKQQHNGHH
jgi:hypothetical protein